MIPRDLVISLLFFATLGLGVALALGSALRAASRQARREARDGEEL